MVVVMRFGVIGRVRAFGGGTSTAGTPATVLTVETVLSGSDSTPCSRRISRIVFGRNPAVRRPGMDVLGLSSMLVVDGEVEFTLTPLEMGSKHRLRGRPEKNCHKFVTKGFP
jgi:hypothetical protein